MEEQIHHFVEGLGTLWLLGLIAVLLAAIGKGADMLVDNAVTVSQKFQIPKAVVGATIVSLGTTLPEAAVSVLAAVKGSPELALGNAVGSIICDTGLILGIAILIRPIPLDKSVVDRQGWLQLGAGLLLVLACFPYTNISNVFVSGGKLSQMIGFAFLILLGFYLFMSVKWGREQTELVEMAHENEAHSSSGAVLIFKTVLGALVVVASSIVLVPAVKEIAIRLHVPEGIIAATLVAFGTSLPELVTVVTASLKGHGELGLGNVVGADILNVLFVAGAAAAVTPAGLEAPKHFFIVLFPVMLFVLILLRVALSLSKEKIGRVFGVLLLLSYIAATALSYAT